MRGALLECEICELVDDKELRLGEVEQLRVDLAFGLRASERRESRRGTDEEHGVARLDRRACGAGIFERRVDRSPRARSLSPASTSRPPQNTLRVRSVHASEEFGMRPIDPHFSLEKIPAVDTSGRRRRNRAAVLVGVLGLVAVAGCKKDDSVPDAGRAAVSANADAMTAADQTATSVAEANGKSLDTPAWPAGAKPTLKLTWAVYPPVGQGETAKRNVEIVARIGDVVRRLSLGPTAGALLPQNQSFCNPKTPYAKGPGDVAKITFYVGGATSYAVSRSSPTMLEVQAVQAADGYCPENNCDTRITKAKIPIPADAAIVEAITDIPAAGKDAPFDCGNAGGSGGAAPEVLVEASMKGAGSCSWMPGAKDPSGKSNGSCSFVLTGAKTTPAITSGKPIHQEFATTKVGTELPAKIVGPAEVVKEFGGCKTTTRMHPMLDEISLLITEPGCASSGLLRRNLFPKGIEFKTTLIRDGKPVPARFKIQPSK